MNEIWNMLWTIGHSCLNSINLFLFFFTRLTPLGIPLPEVGEAGVA